MEIQTTQAKEHQLTELKLYETGSSMVEKIMIAQGYQSLRTRHDEDLKQALRYSMILVGLRANNMPNDEEKFVLLNFIRSNFGNLTPEEIKLGFELAVAGKLNIDAKCYENFSCEYFGRIINAYMVYSTEQTRIIKQKQDELIPLPMPTMNVLKQQAIETANMYADQLRKDSNFKWTFGGLNHLFDILVATGIIEMTKPSTDKTNDYKEFINFMLVNYYYLDENGKLKTILK
jgi:hypothetical protein